MDEKKYNREIQTRERLMQIIIIVTGFFLAYSEKEDRDILIFPFILFIIFAILYYVGGAGRIFLFAQCWIFSYRFRIRYLNCRIYDRCNGRFFAYLSDRAEFESIKRHSWFDRQ